ncbi:MAG: MFS transporter [Hyphomonadaceae bacterium]
MSLPAESEKAPPYRILYASLLIVGMGNSMLQPLLPPLAREIDLPDASLGWIFSLSALFWTFMSPIWGRRSDRVGRRPVIAMGMAAYAVSMGAFAVVVILGLVDWLPGALVFFGLMLSRAIFGAVGSAASPAAQAYVADRSPPSERTERIAALTAAFALGATLGPAICALLAGRFGLVTPIALIAVAAAAMAVLIRRNLPEPTLPDPTAERVGFRESWMLAADPRLAPFLIFGFGLSIVAGTMQQTYTLYLMDRLGVRGEAAAEQAAAGFMVGALALLTTQMVVLPRLKLKSSGYMALGALIVCAGILVQMQAASLGALVVAQFLQGMGFGLTRPGFAGGASMAVTPQEQGAAAGLVVAVNGAGFIFSPITGGVAYQFLHPLAPLALAFAILTAMAIFSWRSRRLRNVEAALAPPTIEPS